MKHQENIPSKLTSKEVMKWRPPERRKRGRPKLTWAEEIRGLMVEKVLMEKDWNDRRNWRKRIISLSNGRTGRSGNIVQPAK